MFPSDNAATSGDAVECVVIGARVEVLAGRRVRCRTLKQHLSDNCSDLLLQNVTHYEGQQSRFVLDEQGSIVRVPGEVEESCCSTPKHVQAGAHCFRVIPKYLESMIHRNTICVNFRLH